MMYLEGQGTVLVKDRYEVLEVLAAGYAGRVVKALDHRHGRLVVLKLQPVGTDAQRETLVHEASALIGLEEHPSLPIVIEDFVEDDQHVVVVEWVDGIDLAKLLHDQDPPGLAPSSVLAYLAEVADALSFLQTRNPPIVHGGVQPANIILTTGGRVKLIHFGTSDFLDADDFLAPEVRAGAPASPASDVYALTATAVALLTGAPPKATPLGGATVGAAWPAYLEKAIEAGMATDPAQRPPTPGALIELLRSGRASELPSGTVTFCLTDIEGSTAMWESQPQVMAGALVRHDELICAAVEAHGGHFLKSKGEGDSTVSVFETADDAVRAAIAANDALAIEKWPEGTSLTHVRFALHTGEAEQRGGDYTGPPINLAARIRSEASGREILLSEATASLIARDPPAGYTILDLGFHQLRGIQRPVRIKALTGPRLATSATAADCPYPGLLAFEPSDRDLFFGREAVLADVLARIAPGQVFALVGPSGSGKSSLLRAGVVAAARNRELPVAQSARLITPGADPPLDLDDDDLLVVDQFEALYTQCHDVARREQFIDALLSRPGPVVIGVRADYYGEISANPALAHSVSQHQVLLGPMSDDDLRRAIAEPARLAGLRLEPGLVDLVLRDVAGEPGALPLMSHALRQTWERRNGRTLTVAAYHESGGVTSAMAQTADAVAGGTPEADRPLLRNVFLRLTEIGDSVEHTRRRVNIDELVPEGASDSSIRSLLERLVTARLITVDDGTAEVAHEILIRRWPMLRHWLEEDQQGIRLHRRLTDAARLWDAESRAPSDLYRGARLDAAVEWAETNGASLNHTERDFLNASVEELARTEQSQLKANRRLREALLGSGALLVIAIGLLAFALVSRHDSVQAARTARSQDLATQSASQVSRDPQLALLLARAALKEAPTPRAALAATEALDANTVTSQLPSFGGQGCLSSNFMFLIDDGRLAADNTCDGYIVVGDLVHRRIIGKVRIGTATTDMILGPGGGSLIVSSGADLDSVDLHTMKVQHLFTAPFAIEQIAIGEPSGYLAIANLDEIGVVDVAHDTMRVITRGDASLNAINGMMGASADELLVATTGQTKGNGDLYPGLTLVNMATGALTPVPLSSGTELASVNFLRVSPDLRSWYVTGSQIKADNNNKVAATWAVDALTRRVRWTAFGPLGSYGSPVQTSPDDRLVAVGYGNGAADVLEASNGDLVRRVTSSSSISAGDVAIPPSDDSLVTVSLDGIFRTWSIHGSEQLQFQAPADPILGFTPDGADLVLIGAQGELVDRRTGQVTATFAGFPASSVFKSCSTACVSTSPDIRWLTYLDPTSTTPRIVELDGRTGEVVGKVIVPRLDAQAVAPNGAIVTAYAGDNHIYAEVIDPRTGSTRQLQQGTSSDGCGARVPAFTPDSRLVVISDGCLDAVVWDMRSGRVVQTIVLPEHATGKGPALSPDGRFVVTLEEGGAIVRSDVATGHSTEVPGVASEATIVAVSPDGRFYAIGRQDGSLDEYDAKTLQLVRHRSLAATIQTVAFSPDGSNLAVEDTTNLVRVWDTCAICENPGQLANVAAQKSVRQFTPGEQATFNVKQP